MYMIENIRHVRLHHQGITWCLRMNTLTTYVNVVSFAFWQLLVPVAD